MQSLIPPNVTYVAGALKYRRVIGIAKETNLDENDWSIVQVQKRELVREKKALYSNGSFQHHMKEKYGRAVGNI